MTHSPRRAEEILQALRLKRPEDINLEAIAWLQGAKVDYREWTDVRLASMVELTSAAR